MLTSCWDNQNNEYHIATTAHRDRLTSCWDNQKTVDLLLE